MRYPAWSARAGPGPRREHSTRCTDVLDDQGERLFPRAVANDQAHVEAVPDRAARHGTAGLVIDQPGSIAQLALAVAAQRATPLAYVPGLVMRRAADLYPGEAKTDRRRSSGRRRAGVAADAGDLGGSRPVDPAGRGGADGTLFTAAVALAVLRPGRVVRGRGAALLPLAPGLFGQFVRAARERAAR